MSQTLINQNQINPDEWQKPSDWIDIRSGAQPNSIYLLVGHKSDYSALNNFGFNVVLSNTSNRFNVYIDYKLYGTYTSGTDVKISWSALALTTGKTTTSPIDLTTHIIRITPEQSTDTISSYVPARVADSGHENQGVLWAHFAVDYALSGVSFAIYNRVINYYLVAITASNNLLHISGTSIENLFGGEEFDLAGYRSMYLAKVPTIEVDTITTAGGAFNHSGPLKKIKVIVNNSFSQGPSSTFSALSSGNTRIFEISKPIVLSSRTTGNSLFLDSKLEKLPLVDISNAENLTNFVTNNTNLKDTVFDATDGRNLTRLAMCGSSTTRMDGLKGLIVSNQAPFNHATSPQLNVSYTGLDRAALVNLFKSMPYNVGYTVVGTPTITDGVASGFSNSNYLATSQAISFDAVNDNYQFIIKFKPIETSWTNIPRYLFGYGASNAGRGGLTITGFKHYYATIYNDGNTSITIDGGADDYINNRETWCKLSVANKVATISKSLDGISWVQLATKDLSEYTGTYTISGAVNIGVGHALSYPWIGSIDLNETYIKLNGVPWFRGTAAMTKTCDVRGCTGTEDLTAADKAICTDKGWSLTVA